MPTLISEQDRQQTARSESLQQERTFAAGRNATIKRLIRSGIPAPMAEAWVASWEAGAAGLHDFRRAHDFWLVGYRYAIEEYKRGYEPPRFVDPQNERKALP